MRGRKPNLDNVVPLTGDETSNAEREVRWQERAHERAEDLCPPDIDDELRPVWNWLVPRFTHPTFPARIGQSDVPALLLACEYLGRFNRLKATLREDGESYESATRNGRQIKSRPEVGQMNEAARLYLSILRDFGGSPSAKRALQGAGGQAELFDEPQDVDFA